MLPRNLEATEILAILYQTKRDPIKITERGGLPQMESILY